MMAERSCAAGSRLGPYEIEGALGAGGMGEVYRAHDTRLDRRVAIKVLPPHLAADRDLRARFEREARAAFRLNDPHICTIHDIGEHEGTAYLVMELIEGITLGAWLRRSPRPDVDAVVDKSLQVARALAAAHEAGIIHRDIKPENVIVRPDGSIKVLDFGIAKLLERPAADAMTMPPSTVAGLVVGTTKYMSPEQARGGPIDARSDLFSLGVMLYEMLAGQAPFEGATATDTVVAILQQEPAAIAQRRPECGADLQRVVATCLEKQAERRYPSARAVIAELERLAARQTPASPALPSIAVLPFVNMSADAENEYFCDGVAEDLIGALTKIERLRVAARTSSFSFKGRNADLKEIGRALSVSSVLEGSVRKAGNRLRITAQLVNVADGYQLWSERYDRQLEDVFAIQDEISLAIVEAMKVRLLGNEKAALVKRHTENVEAFQCYLRGRHHWQSWSRDGFEKAKACMEQALAIDADYALPYVGLADVAIASATIGLGPYAVLVPEARAHITRALTLDPELDQAWTVASVIHFHGWEWQASEFAAAKAVALNPRLAHAHAAEACAYLFSQRAERAVEAGRRAVELDPLSPQWSYVLALGQLQAGDLEAAERTAQVMVDVNPSVWTAHHALGMARMGKGAVEAALEAFENATRCRGGAPTPIGGLITALAACGQSSRAERELAGLLARADSGYCLALPIAVGCAGLGRLDEAFAWLERSLLQDDIWLRIAWWDPLCAALRGDPRMDDLMTRLRRRMPARQD